MKTALILAAVALLPLLPGISHAHTLDKIGDYRLEIGWQRTPPYSGEVNAVVLYVSPLVEGLELKDQPFENGVTGLEDTLKMNVLNRDFDLTLPLVPSDTDGKYYTFIKINKAGFYQVNLLGAIQDLQVSLSMHPPQVFDAEHISFPPDTGPLYDAIAAQDALEGRLDALNSTLDARPVPLDGEPEPERPPYDGVLLAALALGIAGLAMGAAALVRSRRR